MAMISYDQIPMHINTEPLQLGI